MTQLLQLALTLLLAAQQPGVTPELRAQAIFTANYAISYATMVGMNNEEVPRETSDEAAKESSEYGAVTQHVDFGTETTTGDAKPYKKI